MPKTIVDRIAETAIKNACERENRPNDVQYEYKIINNNVLFAIRSKYSRVRQRVENDLLRAIKKRDLRFNLVLPDPLRENDACFHEARFDLYSVRWGIDPNHSFDTWYPFGGKTGYTIRYFDGIRPGDELGIPHLDKMREHGFDYVTCENWDMFLKAYIEAYGMTPLEYVMKITV